MSYKVGDRVHIKPDTFGQGVDKPGANANHTTHALRPEPTYPLPGTVTYVHPRGRWYQVTFDVGVKECFFYDVEPTVVKPDRMKPCGFLRWI